jgi:hypothetical protein
MPAHCLRKEEKEPARGVQLLLNSSYQGEKRSIIAVLELFEPLSPSLVKK